jgi:ABC-type spermidine/putrescine transport system permease subunit II
MLGELTSRPYTSVLRKFVGFLVTVIFIVPAVTMLFSFKSKWNFQNWQKI